MKGYIRSYNALSCAGIIVNEDSRVTYHFNIQETGFDPRYFYDLRGLHVEFDPHETEKNGRMMTSASNVRLSGVSPAV